MTAELADREALASELSALVAAGVPAADIDEKTSELATAATSLCRARSQVTIAETELTIVERRQRGLDEWGCEFETCRSAIAREGEVFAQREVEHRAGNEGVRERGEAACAADLRRAEVAAGFAEAVEAARSELAAALSYVDRLTDAVAAGNSLYLRLRERVEALDIEFAQHYQEAVGTVGGR